MFAPPHPLKLGKAMRNVIRNGVCCFEYQSVIRHALSLSQGRVMSIADRGCASQPESQMRTGLSPQLAPDAQVDK